MIKVLVASRSCKRAFPMEELRNKLIGQGLTPIFSTIEEERERLDHFDAIILGTELFGCEEAQRMHFGALVHKFGVGTDNIDIPCAESRGLTVKHLEGVNANSVAETAAGLIISGMRKITQSDRFVRSNQNWNALSNSLSKKCLGVIGTGNIGVRLTELLTGFSLDLLGFDMYENPKFLALNGHYVDLNILLAKADIISIHLPLNSETKHLISYAELMKVKDNVLIVNTARGPILHEVALFDFLSTHPQATAALDVLESRPINKSPLLDLDNVIITPHIAAHDQETLQKMFDQVTENIINYFKEGQ